MTTFIILSTTVNLGMVFVAIPYVLRKHKKAIDANSERIAKFGESIVSDIVKIHVHTKLKDPRTYEIVGDKYWLKKSA